MDDWREPLQALQAYETWLVRQPLSPRTRGEYVRWVRLFCGWLVNGADERALGADRSPTSPRATTRRGTSSGF